jgi:hypothetical protein
VITFYLTIEKLEKREPISFGGMYKIDGFQKQERNSDLALMILALS